MKKDWTSGSVFKNLITFALPYFLSCFLQALYGMADLYIVGRFNGTSSITAVSIGSQIMHMVTVMIVGLTMGSTVSIAEAIGAQNNERVNRFTGNTITLFTIISLISTAILLLLAGGIVSLVSTPAEAIDGTRSYLLICFAGIPFITAYNVLSSIFRGLGDTKSPMYFIGVACFFNIILDYLFMGPFQMGPAGAAVGTILAQLISVLIALYFLLHKKNGVTLSKEDFIPRKKYMQPIIRIGLPITLQDAFIQVSFITITIIANHRGLTDAAAVGIVEKFISFIFLVPSSMLSSVSALAAQNMGAGKHERAHKTLKYAVLICIVFGASVTVLMQFIAEPIVRLFDSDPQVVISGGQYLKGYVLDCMMAGVHFCFSGFFCAYGHSGISFIHNLISIVTARIPGAYLMSIRFPDTLFPMGFAIGMGSLVSVIICVSFYIIMSNRGRFGITKAATGITGGPKDESFRCQ